MGKLAIEPFGLLKKKDAVMVQLGQMPRMDAARKEGDQPKLMKHLHPFYPTVVNGWVMAMVMEWLFSGSG